MGTRNSTLVKVEGKTKIAQYGQWDGYPTGQGATIQKFLQKADLKNFKEKVKALEAFTQEEIDGIIAGRPEFLVGADTSWKESYPQLSRDVAAGILEMVASGKATKVFLDEDFKNDGLFCEYWYELDLDSETITMNGETFTFEQWKQEGFMEKLEEDESEEE